jgi:hypothetical protein
MATRKKTTPHSDVTAVVEAKRVTTGQQIAERFGQIGVSTVVTDEHKWILEIPKRIC